MVTKLLRQPEVVGQVLVDCRGAGVGREVGAGMAGTASWKQGVQKWM